MLIQTREELNLYINQRRKILSFFWWSFIQGLLIVTGTMENQTEFLMTEELKITA